MSAATPTRLEIQERKLVISQRAALARRIFNEYTVANAEALKKLQADCPHPAAAEVKDYHQSHFKRRCTDCGKLHD
jgi:hypothetical protein